jgi:hypothetical protein
MSAIPTDMSALAAVSAIAAVVAIIADVDVSRALT